MDLTTERADLAFHFNPRFNENGQQVIVRNSCVGNQWGPEERDLLGGFPFVKDKPFEVCRSSAGPQGQICAFNWTTGGFFLCERLPSSGPVERGDPTWEVRL